MEYASVLLKKEGEYVNYAMTDEAGYYKFHDVPAGTYEIIFDATMLTSCGIKETETGIELGEGEELIVNHEMNCNQGGEFATKESPVPVPRKRGVNARYNFAPYLSWGFVAPAGPTKPINYGKSESFFAGRMTFFAV